VGNRHPEEILGGGSRKGQERLPWSHIGIPCLCPGKKQSLAPPLKKGTSPKQQSYQQIEKSAIPDEGVSKISEISKATVNYVLKRLKDHMMKWNRR
jgi:hypothetical protein